MQQSKVPIPQVLPTRFLLNPRADRAALYGSEPAAVLNRQEHEQAFQEMSAWPEYAPTPLRQLPGLAARLGVGGLFVKDERGRFGQGSFKALGGAYGVLKVLNEHLEANPGAGESVTVACASEGNHGRSVAWGAARLGCRSKIFLPDDVSRYRVEAIEALGADVIPVSGGFDEAVEAVAEEAGRRGWLVVSDTAYPGHEEVPRFVMQGYTILVREALDQLPAGCLPTHVFIQGGVGGLAAAVCGHLWETLGRDRPVATVVEPTEADCLFESALVARPEASRGSLETSMSCLASRKPSTLALRVLSQGADAFVTIPDYAAEETVRLLAAPDRDDPPILSQPSGVAGMAGLLAALFEPALAGPLGLDVESRVMVVASEGPAPDAP